ncbi:MAG: CPBP family intramembrane metalloprotease [Acaryochloridaceae cyanobacterium SU_2_1]|nr:CPBP family intramembrane metalloprotease [Acaryochloridaceae cyanobacterium SU_2_1]NJM95240.1 CPBP family intramembrane metalloprotease [Acaryochloridaceae cyanobacterium CSU_5_19]
MQTILELGFYLLLVLFFSQRTTPATQQVDLFDSLVSLIAITLSVGLARRYLDRRSLKSLGLDIHQGLVLNLLVGFLLAGGLMGGIYIVEWQMGWLEVQGYAWEQVTGTTILGELSYGLLIFGLLPSWQEELTDRGYWLQNIKEGLNIAWGISLTSAIFAGRHLLNPHASSLSTAIIFLAGLWLAYSYFVTRQLWLSLGIHAGWNFFEGLVFGFPVSGLTTFHLIEQKNSGPDWITGGSFGPEAGLVGIVAISLGFLFVYYWGQLCRRGLWAGKNTIS